MAHHQSRSTAQMEAQPLQFQAKFQPGRRSCPRRRLFLSTAVIHNCPYPAASWRRFGRSGPGPSRAIPTQGHHAEPVQQHRPSTLTPTPAACLDQGMWRDMRHRTITHANLSKLWNLPPIRVQPVLTALPQQLSATAERKPSRTASSAYQVFSHCYPGPPFSMQGSHGDCSGRGTISSGLPCHGYRGTGEAALGPSDEPASRQSGRLA
jgi:hypothetical protein